MDKLKNVSVILALSIIPLISFAADKSGLSNDQSSKSSACLDQKYINEIKSAFSLPSNLEVAENKPSDIIPGYCDIVLKKGLQLIGFRVSQDGKYLIPPPAMVIEIKNKKPLIVDISKFQKLSQKDLSQLQKHVSFVVNPNSTGKFVYFITDPQCPFCHEAEPMLYKWAKDNNVEIRVILYPIRLQNGEELHPGSFNKSVAIVCSKDKDKWQELINAYDSPQIKNIACESGKKEIESNINLANRLGISGTPTFVGPKGNVISGTSKEEQTFDSMMDQLIKGE